MKRVALASVRIAALVAVALVFPAGLAAQDSLERASQLNAEVVQLYQQGRFAEAIPKAREALDIRARALGATHPEVARSLNNLAAVLEATGDYAGARPLHERALAIWEQALGPAHPDVATSLNNLAAVLTRLGDLAGARPLYERTLKIQEQALGPAHPGVALSLNNLAYALSAAGEYAAARPLYERALAVREQALGPAHPDVAVSLGNLAQLLDTTGDYAAARPLYERALAIQEQALGPAHPSVATTLNNLAALRDTMGDYAGARPLYERALRLREQALGPAHPAVATSLNNLAALLETTGDAAGARSLYERALAIRERVLGPAHPDVALSLNNLAFVLTTTGDHAGARPLYARALRIREQALGPAHPDVAVSLNNLAGALVRARDYAGARAMHERALAIREQALGPAHPDVAASLNNLAFLRYTTGDTWGARALSERALRIQEQGLGPTHPAVATSLNELAFLVAAAGDTAGARALYERARLADLTLVRAGLEPDDEGVRTIRDYGLSALHAYTALLARIAREPFRDSAAVEPAAHAFVAAEQARGGAAQAALSRAGARVAAGDAATAALAREVQELRDRLSATRKLVVAALGRPPAERDAARLGALQHESAQLERHFADATARLRAVFPRYAEVASPEPIDVATARSLLRAGEALVSFLTLDDRVLVWLIRSDGPLVYRDREVKRADLIALVRRVRESLDQSANATLSATRLTPVDLSGAHQLYQLLLEPLAAALPGVTHLLVVPDEVLLPLPFGALLTRTSGQHAGPIALAAYPRLPWLVREYAITVLPSATSLRALRQVPRAPGPETEPLVAFGDPVLKGRGSARGGAMLAARGSGMSLDALRELDRLPGTRDELLAMARALGADAATALYLDKHATKPQVMSLNGTGRLGRARVLAFSTHGLLGGEVQGLRQPALVLTPPATPTEGDDGLLTLDDIVGFRLAGTDWVVLSACNTAAADGSGEGLSGLTRAFFFAGAPSLLVSHWSVDDRATQALMTRVFESYARDRTLPRAELLRQGMLALIADAQGPREYFAHPFAWAAFFLVGEGGAERALAGQRPRR